MIRREIAVFLVVGTLTVGVDYLTYRGLLWSGMGFDVAKAIGFVTGTAFAYVANRRWTFGYKRPGISTVLRFGLLYGVTLLANVGINALVLSAVARMSWAVQVAFLSATAVSATLNFIGMKSLVFRADIQK